jgi:dTDP-4-dehydrorhamnose 3,5-epimerase
MQVHQTAIEGALVLEPSVFSDARGYFLESFNAKNFEEQTGVSATFVQDNSSRSARGVLRGLHFQSAPSQAKLVRVSRGAIFDVIVDLRKASNTFMQWFGVELSEENFKQLWVPKGCAHGFLSLSDITDVHYKTDAYYSPATEGCILWNDPDLAIAWPLDKIAGQPSLSAKDMQGLSMRACAAQLKGE